MFSIYVLLGLLFLSALLEAVTRVAETPGKSFGWYKFKLYLSILHRIPGAVKASHNLHSPLYLQKEIKEKIDSNWKILSDLTISVINHYHLLIFLVSGRLWCHNGGLRRVHDYNPMQCEAGVEECFKFACSGGQCGYFTFKKFSFQVSVRFIGYVGELL